MCLWAFASQRQLGTSSVVALLITSSYFAVLICIRFYVSNNSFSASCEPRTYFQNDLVQFHLKSILKEEIIRLRRVLAKTLCLCLLKMTVPVRPLMNFPSTLHSEGARLHLRCSLGVWHGAGNPLRWESLSMEFLEICNSLRDTRLLYGHTFKCAFSFSPNHTFNSFCWGFKTKQNKNWSRQGHAKCDLQTRWWPVNYYQSMEK